MGSKKVQICPLNRVEGDLDIYLEFEDGVVTDAFSSGTMYRGFENMMKGRAPLDGLVITPRICGICSNSHLAAAAKALDMVTQSKIPDNAVRVRNITMIAEQLQNDIRHHLLQFMPDSTNRAYRESSFYPEAVRRCLPMKGESIAQAIDATRRIVEIIAILGGQWPHSSFMVPGGVVSVPGANDLVQCRYVLRHFRKWYEKQILGCPLAEWRRIKSKTDLNAWFNDSEDHRSGDLGFFIRFAREAGLDKMGAGCGKFICYGFLDMPENTRVASWGGDSHYLRSGFLSRCGNDRLNQEEIAEDASHSWFHDYGKNQHPYKGTTEPYATGSESPKYSWAKGPRYQGEPCETGPLAQMLIAGDPLFTDLVEKDGPNVFARQLARIARASVTIPIMDIWLEEIIQTQEAFFSPYKAIRDGRGYGLVEAPRGALGHWVIIENGKIQSYQVISPTTWNASPRDRDGVLGPWEQALKGAGIKDADNPVEADHIVRSFDPCLVCTVHCMDFVKGG